MVLCDFRKRPSRARKCRIVALRPSRARWACHDCYCDRSAGQKAASVIGHSRRLRRNGLHAVRFEHLSARFAEFCPMLLQTREKRTVACAGLDMTAKLARVPSACGVFLFGAGKRRAPCGMALGKSWRRRCKEHEGNRGDEGLAEHSLISQMKLSERRAEPIMQLRR